MKFQKKTYSKKVKQQGIKAEADKLKFQVLLELDFIIRCMLLKYDLSKLYGQQQQFGPLTDSHFR